MTTGDGPIRHDLAALPGLLSRIEAQQPEALAAAFRAEHDRADAAHVIGVTGPPGVGKSTLIGAVITEFRARGLRVAVVAVDPTSSRTGGAMLGDRLRMGRNPDDDGVFVRSMASRGRLGGLSGTAPAAVAALAGTGFDVVIVETVGVGQSEHDITRLADTTVVMLAPGMGDTMQALKAGLMEEADIFVVNKADQPGAGATATQVNAVLDAGEALGGTGWRPPVLATVAVRSEGIDELLDAVHRHKSSPGQKHRLARVRADRVFWALRDMVVQQVIEAFGESSTHRDVIQQTVDQVTRGEIGLDDGASALLRVVAR